MTDLESTQIHIDGDVQGSNVNTGHQSVRDIIITTRHEHYHSYPTASSPDEILQPPNIPEEVITRAFNAATSRLANIRNTFANTNIRIERSETEKILAWLNSSTNAKKLALVSGNAGQGKSVIMQQLAEKLRNANTNILGIKADDLATIISPLLSLSDLQQLLQIPAPIEQCVRQLATSGPCIVLIDQLDTLALTLNVDEQSLRVIINLIERLREIENVKIVVSCRNFEYMNDPVLGSIKIDDVFLVGELQEDEINRVLEQINQVQVQNLPIPLQCLLRTPLYLDIYAQIALLDPNSDFSQITTLQDLYGRLWRLRIENPDRNAPAPRERREAIFHIVDLMSQQRKLKLHLASLDTYPNVKQYFARTGIIHEDTHTFSFLHQTWFSYVYARKFISDGKSLSEEVFSSPQGFFERQLVTEIVQHLRATDPETYHSEITHLLYPPDGTRVRFHIRLWIIQWLARQTRPTEVECNLLLQLQRTSIDDFQRALVTADTNEAWFQCFSTHIANWLATNDNKLINIITNYLSRFRDIHTTFIIELLRPYLDRSDEWNERIASVIIRIQDWNNKGEAVNILFHLVREGKIYVQASSHALQALGATNPEAGCQLVRLHCELAIAAYRDLRSQQADERNRAYQKDMLEATFNSWEARTFFSQISTLNYEIIIDELLPCFLEVVKELMRDRQPWHGSEWLVFELDGYRVGEIPEGTSFIEILLYALKRLAADNLTAFRVKVNELRIIESNLIHKLIMRAFQANPCEYLDDIDTYISEVTKSLEIRPDIYHLVSAAYECPSDLNRNRLELIIFSTNVEDELADEEKSLLNWRKAFRLSQYYQLNFLLAIDDAILSQDARRKKYELLRIPEFKNSSRNEGIGIVRGGLVVAPISVEKQKALAIEDWLRIMLRYDDKTSRGEGRRNSRRHILEGGVEQMARDLSTQVRENPQKFYLLSEQLSDDISTYYVVALIEGFSSSNSVSAVGWVKYLIRRFNSTITGYFRSTVGNALTKLPAEQVPDDIIDILITWAEEDPNPDCDEEILRQQEILAQTSDHTDGWINRGINTVRGSLLGSVCDILLNKEAVQFAKIFTIISQGISDDCDSVAVIAIQELTNWHSKGGDREEAIHLLEQALNTHPSILTSYPVHNYLNWLSFVYPNLALPYLRTMFESPHAHTRKTASLLICLAGLYNKAGFTELASTLHKHDDSLVRRAAAQAYAGEVGNRDKIAISCERLLLLMGDLDEEVRRQCVACFRNFEKNSLVQLQNFFRQFFQTSAVKEGGEEFIEYLNRAQILNSDEQRLSLTLIRELLDSINPNPDTPGEGVFRLQRDLTLYLRNLYDKSIDHQIKDTIMDLFDELLRFGSRDAIQMLQGEDAKWQLCS